MSRSSQRSRRYFYCPSNLWRLPPKLSCVGFPVSWLTHVSHTLADLSGKEIFIIRMLGDSQNFLLRLENQAWKLHSQEPYLKSCHRIVKWKHTVKVGAWCWQQSHHHWSLAVADFSVITCVGGFESSPESHVLKWMLLTGRAVAMWPCAHGLAAREAGKAYIFFLFNKFLLNICYELDTLLGAGKISK